MSLHKERFSVNSHDGDMNEMIRPSAVLRYMQEAVNRQCRFRTPGSRELAAQGRGFILSRVVVENPTPIMAYDEIDVATWPIVQPGVRFLRFGTVERQGTVIARMATIWALVDLESRRLLRSTDLDWVWESPCDTLLDMPYNGVMRHPEDVVLSERGTYVVGYRDVDIYRHMNNTAYPDVITGFLPDFVGKRVTSYRIDFLAEAPLGERLAVLASDCVDGKYYVRTVREDGKKNIEAVLTVENV